MGYRDRREGDPVFDGEPPCIALLPEPMRRHWRMVTDDVLPAVPRWANSSVTLLNNDVTMCLANAMAEFAAALRERKNEDL